MKQLSPFGAFGPYDPNFMYSIPMIYDGSPSPFLFGNMKSFGVESKTPILYHPTPIWQSPVAPQNLPHNEQMPKPSFSEYL